MPETHLKWGRQASARPSQPSSDGKRLGLGAVEAQLRDRIQKEGCVHLSLLDPEKPGQLYETVKELEKLGTAAIMVGGSTVNSSRQIGLMLRTIKASCSLPTILFPNSATGIDKHADAIFFMSLLNSSSTKFLIGAQVQGAPIVKEYGIEPIPLGYMVVGNSETAVSTVGSAERIPYSKPELAASYALAAQYLGMRFVYLEAGSGAEEPVNSSMVEKVASTVDIPVIVGGGIRNGRQAQKIAKAGASAIVTGTVLEQEGTRRVREIISAIRRA